MPTSSSSIEMAMMSENYSTNNYLIHDKMIIYVDKEVSTSVAQQIDFQIGYFQVRDLPEVLPPLSIQVFPFERLSSEKLEPMISFHTQIASCGELLIDPAQRIALIRGMNSYTVYTDNAFLINLLMQLLWNESGNTFIHAAAVANPDGEVILLPGAGGVGKTSLVGYLVRNHGYKLLGDDLVLIDHDSNCFAFPRPFIIKEYHREDYPEVFKKLNSNQAFSRNGVFQSSRWNRKAKSMIRFIIDNAPFVGVTKSILKGVGLMEQITPFIRREPILPFVAAVPIEEILGADAVKTVGSIHKVFFLERSSSPDFSIKSIDHSSIVNRVFSIIHHEWTEVMRQFFTLGAVELEDTADYFKKTRGIIEHALSGQECLLVSIPNNSSPQELGKYFMGLLEID